MKNKGKVLVIILFSYVTTILSCSKKTDSAPYVYVPQVPVDKNWSFETTPVWADEFTNTGTPDTSKWTYDLGGGWGVVGHVGSFRMRNWSTGTDATHANYTDWKLGATWLYNGYNIGAYYSDTNAKDAGYVIAGKNIGKSTGTVFIQKTF